MSKSLRVTLALVLSCAGPVGNAQTTAELIGGRETYCHENLDCEGAAMGAVSAQGYSQCKGHIFGPLGKPGQFRAWSFQSVTDGKCLNFKKDGSVEESSKKLYTPQDGIQTPKPWTGVSCYPEAGCQGSRLAVVWDWRDCVKGTYPTFEDVPPSKKIGAKSYFWGATCWTIPNR